MLKLEKRSLKQFVKNLEVDNKNILQIFCMKLYSGFKSNHFLSDHVAWLDTPQDASVSQEDILKQFMLCWTDVSIMNFVQ